MISVFRLPHVPDHVVCIALFKDVTNASFLRQQLLDGNTDFEYAFIDASTVSVCVSVSTNVWLDDKRLSGNNSSMDEKANSLQVDCLDEPCPWCRLSCRERLDATPAQES
jgi:Kinase binding protein CGI-121